MALLTDKQKERELKRERERQQALARKKEIQMKKELFGENYKQVERAAIENEMAKEIGSENTPKLYDFSDVYDFFDPIIMYKSKEGKALKMDFTQFQLSEEKFKQELEEVDALLGRLNKEDDIKTPDKKEQEENKVKESDLVDDGTTEFDETNALAEGELLQIQEDEVDEKIMQEEGDFTPEEKDPGEDLFKEHGAATVKRATAIAKAKLNQVASIYLERFVPRYNKQICSCCGLPKKVSDFYVVYDISCNSNVDDKGARHMHICKECCQKLFNYYYSVVAKKDIELAMQYMCSNLNLYWDNDVFQIVRKKFEDSGRKGTLFGSYISYINSHAPGLTLMDSPFLAEDYETVVYMPAATDAPYDWSKEDAKNKKDVIHILGYDPFEYEENEDDKKILYADLISVIDEEIQQDYVKLQSALTIVKSFHKVRKLDEKAHKMEAEGASLNEQKAIAELKAKELKAISDFSRDSGFSERFKTKQNMGETSFTGIVKKMNEKKYEDELINKYDIETSSTIQAAADASFKAIFNQLNLSEAEAYQIAAEQLAELRKVKTENDSLQEKLRRAKYQLAELQLKEKAREKGVEEEDD